MNTSAEHWQEEARFVPTYAEGYNMIEANDERMPVSMILQYARILQHSF